MLDVVRPDRTPATRSAAASKSNLASRLPIPPLKSARRGHGRAREIFPHLEALWPLYDDTSIDLLSIRADRLVAEAHSWEERAAIFQKHALDLLGRCHPHGDDVGRRRTTAINMIVTITITGSRSRPRRETADRLGSADRRAAAIFGLGYSGGVAGLARRRGWRIDQAPCAFPHLNLSSLCLRINDPVRRSSSRRPCSVTARPACCCAHRRTAKHQRAAHPRHRRMVLARPSA